MDETRAEFTEYRRIKPRIREFQAQRIFPVDPPTDSIRGLAVGQVFGELEDQHQRQPCWCFSRLPRRRKEGGKLGIRIEGAQRIADLEAQRTLRKSRVGHTSRFCGDGHHRGRL
jgi:hypothetical protein